MAWQTVGSLDGKRILMCRGRQRKILSRLQLYLDLVLFCLLSFLARFYVRLYVLYICRGIYDSCRLHLFICSNQETGGGSKMVGQMAGHVHDYGRMSWVALLHFLFLLASFCVCRGVEKVGEALL